MRFKSSIDLSDDTKTKLVDQLNLILANTLDVHSQIKQAHWTIKGPQFFARHELFDAVAQRAREQADDLAERVAALGGYPEGTVRMTAKTSQIKAFEPGHSSGAHLMRDLVVRLSMHATSLRDALGTVEKHDPVTADLVTECLRATELDLWFFESHLSE